MSGIVQGTSAKVRGNGLSLGLRSSVNGNFALTQGNYSGGLVIQGRSGVAGTAIGTSAPPNLAANNTTVGITEDSSLSGIEAELSQVQAKYIIKY